VGAGANTTLREFAQGQRSTTVQSHRMTVSSPSSSASVASAHYQIAVAKKELDSTRIQGQQSLELIQAAAAPANVPNGVGQQLNIVA